MKRIVGALLMASIVIACSAAKPGGPLYADPKVYPCGINGNYCDGPGHPFPCCGENNSCGGHGTYRDPTCFDGECCFVGSSNMEAKTGIRHGTPMRFQ